MATMTYAAVHLAIDLDPRGVQPTDKRAVRHAVHARGRVDTDDPQASEIALLVLSIAIRIAPATLNSFFRGFP
jgi:hypothetical protein